MIDLTAEQVIRIAAIKAAVEVNTSSASYQTVNQVITRAKDFEKYIKDGK